MDKKLRLRKECVQKNTKVEKTVNGQIGTKVANYRTKTEQKDPVS